MAYDEATARRVRRLLSARDDVTEKRMVGGGLSFIVGGSMRCGVTGDALMLRVGAEAMGRTLTEPHVRRMELGGRPLAGFVLVDLDACRSDDQLAAWLGRVVDLTPG
jgi:hypothetical protein